MKKVIRVNIGILSAAVLLVLLFTGCKGDTAGGGAEGGVKSGAAKDSEETAEIADSGTAGAAEQNADAGDVSSDVKTDEPKPDHAELAKASMEAYERFLNDQEPIYFDNCNLDGEQIKDDGYYENRFRENTPYRFEEVLNAFVKHNEILAGDSFEMGRVEYAYIDCGADAVPELVVRIADYATYIDRFSEVYVIKLMDQKLQLCHSFGYGYRTMADINEYGYIVSGGSTGASSYSQTEEFINAEGELVFIYNLSARREEYENYEFEMESYAFKPFSAYDPEDEDCYEKYVNDQVHTYWMIDEKENWVEDESTYPYCEYFRDSSKVYLSHAEVDALLIEQKEKSGVTDMIIDGGEPEWTVLAEAPKDETIIVKNPGWEYYCDDSLAEAPSHISLEKISQESNGIIDYDDWFTAINKEMPNWDYQSDGKYHYHMYSRDNTRYYPNMLEISDLNGKKVAELDFSEFYIPDEYYPADAAFVTEAIHSPRIEGNILYIGVFHNTYAASAPHNGYLIALDMNDDYRVLWKTEPLTCNSDNFDIAGDTIICGYGFTNEDDFIYLLDKNTGKRVDTIKVKTSPDYFYVIEDKLYVRTYNTNYVFQIKE